MYEIKKMEGSGLFPKPSESKLRDRKTRLKEQINKLNKGEYFEALPEDIIGTPIGLCDYITRSYRTIGVKAIIRKGSVVQWIEP